MTDRPAIRAEEGIPSRPGVHLGLREARDSSHQARAVEVRDSFDSGGGTDTVGHGREAELAEDTATKWLLRVSATEEVFVLK